MWLFVSVLRTLGVEVITSGWLLLVSSLFVCFICTISLLYTRDVAQWWFVSPHIFTVLFTFTLKRLPEGGVYHLCF